MSSTFLDPKHITHEVGGVELKFYPITVGAAFKLRKVAKPLAKGLGHLFGANAEDQSRSIRSVRDDQGNNVNEHVVEAISPQLAELRAKQSAEAIEDVTTALLEPSSLDIVEALIRDSLRDDQEHLKDFTIAKADIKIVTQFLTGLGKANFGALPGPLADRLRAQVQAAAASEQETVGETSPTP